MIEITYTAKKIKFKNCLIEISKNSNVMEIKKIFLGVEKREKTQHIIIAQI